MAAPTGPPPTSPGLDVTPAVGTFRSVRVGIPLLLLTLLAAVALQVGQDGGCYLGSVSAYWYTAARSVFVAVLVAVGVLLVVHEGNSTWEDHALDFSGAFALVVGFVPLRPLVAGEPGARCPGADVPTAHRLADAVSNNVLALLVGLTGLVVVRWYVRRRTEHAARRGRTGRASLVVGTVVVAVGWVLQLVAPAVVREHGHVPAAVLLFAGVSGVVALNAVPALARRAGAPVPGAPYLRLYQGVLAELLLAFVVLGPLAALGIGEHVVFWLEALLIAGFAVFWVVQTAELWDARDRSQLAARPARARR
ncbi:hypothetical protein [Lapillicoccus jejuensis]|uniref:Uncharacterized protein n=1 Tax=Lapillicoccus jejuensis TaxID=402171 RepID=A0A542DVQ8_9MICO|nr:hypothetical protein [Lapillicoccus jejuensis]TQJ07189.1 hypothetical protein FB458_0243 [Lapillicoccus jejuensis]